MEEQELLELFIRSFTQFKKFMVHGCMPGLGRVETVIMGCVVHKKKKYAVDQVKVADIVRATGMPASGVSRALRRLEEKGMLVRTQKSDDRRVTLVALTSDGQAQFERYHEKLFERLRLLIDQFGEARTEEMIALLNAFYEQVETMLQKDEKAPEDGGEES